MEKKLRKYLNRKFLLYPKTNKILEVREELYSIMLDKYNDCLSSGMSEDESYKNAVEMMIDYKDAIREVETGSSLSALKKKLINTAFVTSFYYITLTFIYLFVSMVVLKTFEKTWLIVVGGAFTYLVYFSVTIYGYAKLFNFKTLARCGIAIIYFNLVPVFYVFPSLYLSTVYSKNVWNRSWLVAVVILFFYILTDYIVYLKQSTVLEKSIHLLALGFTLTTIIYLSMSMWFQLWGIAWIIYVVYLAIVTLVLYIIEKRKG
ncbi:MAG TPA: hypothetical protein PK733_14005 [Clostridiales bacterium]|nr:hypothetical protein [Clostridiales bacterium]